MNLHKTLEYIEAYRRHTDQRVLEDPHEAVGGYWEERGLLQLNFLIKKGLKPEDTLLDIGCGTLRAGRHFIRYLNKGNYFGMDISPKALEYAKKLIVEKGLQEKEPILILNNDLRFQEFNAKKFKYILAQSVFTHLPAECVEECFRYIGNIMNNESIFYFNFNPGTRYKRFDLEDFAYSFSHFKSLAEEFGFSIRDCSDEYEGRGGMWMLEVRKLKRK